MRHWTIILLASISVLLIGWDVWVYLADGSQATISVVVRDVAQTYPSVPFLLGVLSGHMLWPLPSKKPVRLVDERRVVG